MVIVIKTNLLMKRPVVRDILKMNGREAAILGRAHNIAKSVSAPILASALIAIISSSSVSSSSRSSSWLTMRRKLIIFTAKDLARRFGAPFAIRKISPLIMIWFVCPLRIPFPAARRSAKSSSVVVESMEARVGQLVCCVVALRATRTERISSTAVVFPKILK